MNVDRLADPLDLCPTEWLKCEIALDQFSRAVADDCGSGIGNVLQPGRQIHGMSDWRVFSMHGAGLNCSHHHLTGICSRPDLDWGTSFCSQACAIAPDFILHSHRGI